MIHYLIHMAGWESVENKGVLSKKVGDMFFLGKFGWIDGLIDAGMRSF